MLPQADLQPKALEITGVSHHAHPGTCSIAQASFHFARLNLLELGLQVYTVMSGLSAHLGSSYYTNVYPEPDRRAAASTNEKPIFLEIAPFLEPTEFLSCSALGVKTMNVTISRMKA